jgi:short-subunit dehydrogenase
LITTASGASVRSTPTAWLNADTAWILIARNRSRLAALAQRLKNDTSRSVETIATAPRDLRQAIECCPDAPYNIGHLQSVGA